MAIKRAQRRTKRREYESAMEMERHTHEETQRGHGLRAQMRGRWAEMIRYRNNGNKLREGEGETIKRAYC